MDYQKNHYTFDWNRLGKHCEGVSDPIEIVINGKMLDRIEHSQKHKCLYITPPPTVSSVMVT